jgi:hypothetical protein
MSDRTAADIGAKLSVAAKNLLSNVANEGAYPVLRLSGAPFELIGHGLAKHDAAAASASWKGYLLELTDLGRAVEEAIRGI